MCGLTFQPFFWKIIQFRLKGKWFVCHRLQEEQLQYMCAWPYTTDLVFWIVVLLQVRVGQSLLNCYPSVGVKGQHLVQ